MRSPNKYTKDGTHPEQKQTAGQRRVQRQQAREQRESEFWRNQDPQDALGVAYDQLQRT